MEYIICFLHHKLQVKNWILLENFKLFGTAIAYCLMLVSSNHKVYISNRLFRPSAASLFIYTIKSLCFSDTSRCCTPYPSGPLKLAPLRWWRINDMCQTGKRKKPIISSVCVYICICIYIYMYVYITNRFNVVSHVSLTS